MWPSVGKRLDPSDAENLVVEMLNQNLESGLRHVFNCAFAFLDDSVKNRSYPDSKCQWSQLHVPSPLVHTDAAFVCVQRHVVYLCISTGGVT